MDFLNPDWYLIAAYAIQFAVAFILVLPIAWEREQSTRAMGLRTFPLVAVASCGYVLVATAVLGKDNPDAHARIIQGLMSGIGFIGGGAILKEGANVRGTATAASIWTTGAIGGAVGYQHYTIAIVISLVNFLVLRVFTSLKEHTDIGNEEPSSDAE